MLIIALLVRLDSPGPALYWSQRYGANGVLFSMPKFRSMAIETPEVATHLLTDGASRVTRAGKLLRSTSLDELPQLFSVLLGKMSLVGPRPALHNQHDLMELRRSVGVDGLRPGITGWAQVNGRDNLTLEAKVAYETEYLSRRSFFFDLQIIACTLVRGSKGVKH